MRRECREHCPCHRLQRKSLVSEPGMHHGACVTHVPWCMSGSLTRGGDENGIPGAWATRNFTYLAIGPWRDAFSMANILVANNVNNTGRVACIFHPVIYFSVTCHSHTGCCCIDKHTKQDPWTGNIFWHHNDLFVYEEWFILALYLHFVELFGQ